MRKDDLFTPLPTITIIITVRECGQANRGSERRRVKQERGERMKKERARERERNIEKERFSRL